MKVFSQLVAALASQHQQALNWFHENAGTEHPWPQPLQGGLRVVTRAKGIYKPAWSDYALSVRQTLNGPYPDRELRVRPDGTWRYDYFQENTDPQDRDAEYTNRGLLACWRDEVPVGVMRQVREKPTARYRILGTALVAGWSEGYFALEGFSSTGLSHGRGPSPAELAGMLAQADRMALADGTFDLLSITEARERVLASIVRRRGQPNFRSALIAAYEGRCAISGCDVLEALEAAHIVPYQGEETQHISNGLLLRADLHTLFDLGVIAVDPDQMKVLLSASAARSSYEGFGGKQLRVPESENLRPSKEALRLHRQWAGL